MSPPNGRTVRGFLSEAITETFDEQDSNRLEVFGQVKGAVPEGATVRAVVTTLHERVLDEQVVGEASLDEGGWYGFSTSARQRTANQTPASRSGCTAPNGELLGQSVPCCRRRSERRFIFGRDARGGSFRVRAARRRGRLTASRAD